jgi:hypothetical protein
MAWANWGLLMIANYEENKIAAVFGYGSLEVANGNNDKMDNLPYILVSEWSEPQRVGLLREGQEVTGAATGKSILLQFNSKESFEVFYEAVERTKKELGL